MGDVGILQEGYIACDITGDPDISDLLQRTPFLPNRNGDQLRHVAVVVGSYRDGQTS